MTTLEIFCDGGARGNPGPAAAAFIAKIKSPKPRRAGLPTTPGRQQGQSEIILKKNWKYLGTATNNQAEYQAVILALTWLKKTLHSTSGPNSVNFFLDSRLVVNHLNGLFKIKNSTLRESLLKIRQLESEIPADINYRLIPREKNRPADFLVNLALNRSF